MGLHTQADERRGIQLKLFIALVPIFLPDQVYARVWLSNILFHSMVRVPSPLICWVIRLRQHQHPNDPVDQLELEAKTCDLRQARENARWTMIEETWERDGQVTLFWLGFSAMTLYVCNLFTHEAPRSSQELI